MFTRTFDPSTAVAPRRTSGMLVTWLLPLALVVLALAVYLPTLSDVHTFDALSYIRDVDQRAGFFFHPHHLLYSPTGWLFWQAWRVVGYNGNSELALKVLNSVVGAACGVGLYRVVLGITGRWWAALTAAGLLLFNYGAWYFSVEVEVYVLALIWLLLTLALLFELVTQPRSRTAPLLGVTIGLAALYHQTNGLLVPIVVTALLLSPLPWRQRGVALATIGALSGGIVALGYSLVGFGYNGYRSLSELHAWMFFFVETGWWGHAVRDRWTDLGAGLGNTVSPQGAWIYWLLIGTLLVLGLPAATRRRPRIVAICALWIAIFGGFFFWWEGENIEFWIATLLPLWVLVGLSVAELGAWLDRRIARWQQAAGIAVLLPLALAWHNYPIVQRRGDASQDLQRQLARKVQAITSPADLIVAPGGVMELYLPYYEARPNVHTINGVLFETNGDIPTALDQLRHQIETSLHAGLSVLVGLEAMELQPEIFQRYPITQAQLDAFWTPYRASLQPAVEHNGTIYWWRIAAATEFASGDGWRWNGATLGWQAANVTNQSLDGGWCFDPQSDPTLLSPVITLDAARFHGAEITLRTLLPDQTAQLFFAGSDGAMSDAQSVSWPLEGDGAAHTYTVALADVPGWNGSITRLRLDPIAVGDGTAASRTCVEAIRLLP